MGYKYYFFGVVIVVAFSLNKLMAQQTITTSQLLAASKKAPTVLLQQKNTNAYNSLKYQLPIIDKIGVQTETDRFHLERQEVLGRVWFNNFKQNKAVKGLQNKEQALSKTAEQGYFANDINDKYASIVNYKKNIVLKEFNKKLLAILLDKRTIYQQKAKLASTDFDIQDLIKNEELIFEFTQKIDNENLGIDNALLQWQQWLGTPDSLQLDIANDFIKVNTIKQIVNQINTASLETPDMAKQVAKLQVLQQEMNVEKTQNTKVLDYVQVKNSARNKDALVREFSVGFGLLIPYKSQLRIKQHELNISKIEEENKLALIKINTQKQLTKQKQKIELLINQYNLLQQRLNESQSNYSIEQYTKIKSLDPLILLRMKELKLHSESNLLQTEFAILEAYLDVLSTSAVNAQAPYKNYLTNSLQPF